MLVLQKGRIFFIISRVFWLPRPENVDKSWQSSVVSCFVTLLWWQCRLRLTREILSTHQLFRKREKCDIDINRIPAEMQASLQPHTASKVRSFKRYKKSKHLAGTKRLNTVNCAGIFEQSMRARNPAGVGLSYRPPRLHRLAESIPWNQYVGSLKV